MAADNSATRAAVAATAAAQASPVEQQAAGPAWGAVLLGTCSAAVLIGAVMEPFLSGAPSPANREHRLLHKSSFPGAHHPAGYMHTLSYSA